MSWLYIVSVLCPRTEDGLCFYVKAKVNPRSGASITLDFDKARPFESCSASCSNETWVAATRLKVPQWPLVRGGP